MFRFVYFVYVEFRFIFCFVFFAQILEQLGVTVDHYELEWCGTGARLEVPRAMSWQLLVKESGQATGNNKPFGYLR